MKRISIIGGGASGTLLTANLLRLAGNAPVEINLVERRSRIGRGVAFGTSFDSHLLNVPAGRMGAYPDEVDHFHKWLSAGGHGYEANDFVPRRLFGEYLRRVFTDAAESADPNVRLNLIDDEAVDLSVGDADAQVMLNSGEILPSHRVVLAFGNFSPPSPSVEDLSFASSPKYFADPWGSALYDAIRPDDSVFIIGTGLSMVDVALHLNNARHRGKISAISTRGLLPAVHKLGFTYENFYDELKDMRRITDILKAVRRHISKAESNGSDWRAVIDSLRPVTQEMWLDLPQREKEYFKQHLSRYWNVARHRMPQQAASVLDAIQADGRLEILRGRLRKIRDDGEFGVEFDSGGTAHTRNADILVNCIGSEANFTRIDSKFVKNLVARGHVRNDAVNLGIDALPDGNVVGKTGSSSNIVWTLGTALKGVLWESTAIPEIRAQARALALKLLAD
ncbi:MAG TPA: FAD/NAD(P)-binding protein [Pyrinomonadaceae bacterium]|jgi:uncharacterized NAD(P)/FAD-binding protein YdhS|nr:FAD/NAD(P)-binding protein [Pyrinomonadaceae bacterium]